ncbi:hypothetical protein EBZ39_10280 [bacterium]|nr:hypothetical protein [bacterium]
MSEEKIPKFRSANRLVLWVRQKWLGERLPADREKVFFKCHEKNPIAAAVQLAEYASFVGKLDAPLEILFLSEPQSLLKYIKIVHNREQEVNPALVQALKGNSSLLFSWAHHTKKRLDEDLENALDDGTPQCARWCYRYAKEVLKGKLPEHLEEVFSKYDDSYHASKYAFDVIRGFAPCRLSDNLHTYMVMKSFQNPNVEHIKVYMDASESNPELVGNSSARVT